MALPPRPRKRFVPGLSPGRRVSTPERLRQMTKEHEEEERPFDPEKRGTWRGGAHEKLVINPSQFYKDLEELIVKRWGRTLSDPEEKLAEATRILKEGGEPGDVMRDLDALLDTHGVEYIPGLKNEISYLNAGDTYEPTIMYSEDDDKYFVSDWGTLVEEASSTAEQDAWDDWLESEVRRELEREFEARFVDDERAINHAVTALEDLDSAALQREFWHALQDAGGEYVHESGGSIFVSEQNKAIEELAERIIKKMSAVPEQGSFGFNPRSRNPREPNVRRPEARIGALRLSGDLHADRLSAGTQRSTGWPTETWVVREADKTPVQQVEIYKHGDGAWHAWTGSLVRDKQKALAREVAAERNHV